MKLRDARALALKMKRLRGKRYDVGFVARDAESRWVGTWKTVELAR